MGVLIDEVFTEVSTPLNTEPGGEPLREARDTPTPESETALCERLKRIQLRQLRLTAD